VTLRVIIADDEPLSIEMLNVLLIESAVTHGPIEIVATCKSGRETIAASDQYSPDLIFLDVNMPGGSGMVVAKAIQEAGKPLPQIIFTTAHTEFAADAFDVDAIDYLLKPVELKRLTRALERASQARRSVVQRTGKMIPVPVLGGIELLEVSNIQWVEASGDYLTLNTTGRSFLIRKTLSAFAKDTYPALQQTHRSYLVNLSAVNKVIPRPKGEAILRLVSGAEVPVSRRHRAVLQELSL
jgi:two-component system LytT family response regulator